MSGGLVTAAYIVAAILFIFSLAGLSKHETSRQGNNFGIAGMAIALLATIFGPDTGNVAWILVAMIIGGAIGIRMAKKVEMTEMPELVAILHSFVGLAAVLPTAITGCPTGLITLKKGENVQLITRLSKKLTASIEVFHHSTQIISERENKGSERWLLIVSLGISIKLSRPMLAQCIA